MGSSIGVARAGSQEEIDAILQSIFVYDSKALIEPYVASRAEYNISVRRTGGTIATSAIELPKTTAELLDFKEKYVRGNGPKKTGGSASEGMLSLTRELNPKLNPALEADIRRWASEIFEALDGTGTPRLDFMLDTDSNEIWFNEINPCPGSFAYFLWEAASNKALFSELLTDMLNEAIACRELTLMPVDPVPGDARLFKRA
jgi:D-alanine-D-alanine ligase